MTLDPTIAAGGGAYAKISYFNFSIPGTTQATYRVGGGAAAGTSTALCASGGRANPGGDTWFNGTDLAGSSVGAKGGTGGCLGDTMDSAVKAGPTPVV
jgi:hypothetical protein